MLGQFVPQMNFYFLMQSNHSKYIILLICIAKLPELYILTNSDIKADKSHFRNREITWNYKYEI